jgi:ribosomal-protein-alanine N-acetyltransferase
LIQYYCIVSTAVGEATVLNLCIDPVIRKQGLGRKFMQHVIDTAKAKKSESVKNRSMMEVKKMS